MYISVLLSPFRLHITSSMGKLPSLSCSSTVKAMLSCWPWMCSNRPCTWCFFYRVPSQQCTLPRSMELDLFSEGMGTLCTHSQHFLRKPSFDGETLEGKQTFKLVYNSTRLLTKLMNVFTNIEVIKFFCSRTGIISRFHGF